MSTTLPSIKTVIRIDIIPAGTRAQTLEFTHRFNLRIRPIELDISEALVQTILQAFDSSVQTYVDEEVKLKAVLNYGDDRQSVILNQRFADVSPVVNSVQLKLLQPVPDDIGPSRLVFIGREIAQTVIDKLRIRFAPEIDNTPFLRPKNTKVSTNVSIGNNLKNVTLNSLSLSNGVIGSQDSYTNLDFENEVIRRWYTDDFKSVELNIDYTDYNNFVFYSSATMRLLTFREKLKSIENLNNERIQFINNSYTANSNSAGSLQVQQQTAELSSKIENIIRGFDQYEQYLYSTPSGSNLPYSASAYYADTGVEYNSISYWPKSGSVLYAVTSSQAEEWFSTQLEIAKRFDEFNENNLVNTIPSHIREDINSDAYVTFVTMVGHLFDNIKPYVDQFPFIYSRNLDPNYELSKDLVSDIADSFGFKLPSVQSKTGLSKAVIGTNAEQSTREITTELHKRLLHNFPLFTKTKGTKSALQILIKTLGLSSEFLNIKETAVPTEETYSTYEEYSNGIKFDGLSGSYIELPIAASSRTSKTLQVNCSFASPQTTTILNGDDLWSLQVVKHPTNNSLGRLELTTGSSYVKILTSSYTEIFDDKLINFAIVNTNDSTRLVVNKLYNTDVLYSSSMEVSSSVINFNNIWNSTNKIYLGGSGSLVVNPYIGTLDEVRLWSSSLSDKAIINNANDPGSITGDGVEDSLYALYVQLSFNRVPFSGSITNILNESPYLQKNTSPSLSTLLTQNISGANVTRYSREIKQYSLIAGSLTYTNNKVVVAPPPVFTISSLDQDGVKTLSRTRSIKKPETKINAAGKNIISISTSPTDIINQNISRTLGAQNVNAVLGLPRSYSKAISALTRLRNLYNEYYKVDVNINLYIQVVEQINSLLTQIIDYFIPARASLLRGITIEPNLLERTEINALKNIRVYGKNTRKTLDAVSSLTSSAPDYQATFNVSDNIPYEEVRKVTGSIANYTSSIVNGSPYFSGVTSSLSGIISLESSSILRASTSSLNGLISEHTTEILTSSLHYYYLKHIDYYTLALADAAESNWADVKKKNVENSGIDTRISEVNKFKFNSKNQGSPGSEPYGRIYPRKLFTYEISADRPGGVTSLNQDALYAITPSANFADEGVYTYYNSPTGVYYFDVTNFQYTYVRPVNIETATTWSFNSAYNLYDVAYQNVQTNDTNLSQEQIRDAIRGNGRLYVFIGRASYVPPETGQAYYLNSVPTTIPPSLDLTNWEPLKFLPFKGFEPRRVIFVGDPILNNYKTTTVSINKAIDRPTRAVDLLQVQEVPGNSQVTGQLLLQNLLSLLAIQSNTTNIRVRFYRTAEARNADISRSVTTVPTGSHGVLLDMSIYTTDIENINPSVQFVSDGSPPSGIIYYTIDNLTPGEQSSINLYLYYFAYEIQTRVPRGYLRKHYRFFRDNSTAKKRRDYIGCLNTQETTYDKLPPVQVILAEGRQLVVADSISTTQIIPDGEGSSGGTAGGTINVL